MNNLLTALLGYASHGTTVPDLGLAVVRVASGTFFALSGYNKLTNAGRHASLLGTLVRDKVPLPKAMAWWVPGWELLGGLLVALGLLAPFGALVLIIICAVACKAEAAARVAAYAPINGADRIDDWLYLPEVLYIAMLAVTLFAGPGAYTVARLF